MLTIMFLLFRYAYKYVYLPRMTVSQGLCVSSRQHSRLVSHETYVAYLAEKGELVSKSRRQRNFA